VERVKGIEPSLSAWEADVLPLNYTRGRRNSIRSCPDGCKPGIERSGCAAVATITIPVVVHVISEDGTRTNGNIPDTLIASQIDVLNKSYAASKSLPAGRAGRSPPVSAPGES